MEIHVYPIIGNMPVAAVDMPDIRRVLLPHNGTSSLLGTVARRMSVVRQWSIVMRHRTLADSVQIVVDSLPRVKSYERQSHASVHHTAVNAAITAVNATKVLPATKCAFAFMTLTACRTEEILGARWDEIDGDTWTVPGGEDEDSEGFTAFHSAAKLSPSLRRQNGCLQAPWYFKGGDSLPRRRLGTL